MALCHEIDTGDALPIAVKPRKLSAEKQTEVKRQIAALLGAVEHAKGPWAGTSSISSKRGESGDVC